MKVLENRPKDMGYLFVVGGPGGSGSSTISRMLARKYGLHYVYGGQLMREFAKQKGFDDIDDFLDSLEDEKEKEKYIYDKKVDKKILMMSYKPDVLVESKNFAAIATMNRIPTTVKVWLTASVYARVRRVLHKEGKVTLEQQISKGDPLYIETRDDLMRRFSNDKNRYQKLYSIDYDHPEKYNDIVIDSSDLSAHNTFNLIVRKIEDGRYLKEG